MSKILLLVEGAKTEKQLLDHFYKLYEKSQKEIETYILPYGTHIYVFYKKFKEYFLSKNGEINHDLIDLPLFLNDYLKPEENLNDMDFNEHILIFDFEPHDQNYSELILVELMEIFADSTKHGKLYLNYPTVESFKDITSLDDEDTFINSTVTLNILKQRKYKSHVDNKAKITQLNHINKINKEIGNRLLKLHNQKLTFITKHPNDSNEKYLQLCKKQCKKLEDEKLIWIINTCILHLLDEYGPMP